MNKLYLISLLFIFLGCGKNNPSSTQQTDSNQSTIVHNDAEGRDDSNSQTTNTHVDDNNSQTTDTHVDNSNSQTIDTHLDDNNSEVIDNNSEDDTNTIQESKKTGKAQLGVLSKASVKLYELNGEERKLLTTEQTTNGESIETIGNFNLHLEKLADNKLYLYEIYAGEDYDVDDDGVIDENPTKNSGIFHLLALGSHIKAVKELKVTIISEIIFQKLYSSLTLTSNEIIEKMKLLSKEIIAEDINSDGFIGIEDILKYNPINDKSKLQEAYKKSLSTLINDILNNKASDFDAPIFKGIPSTIAINENLTFIGKIEINDASKITVSLLGEDANKLNYNPSTQELSFKTLADFEMPQDSNGDNIFEVTLEATDSYFNKSSRSLSIEVLDINETIPKPPSLKDSNLSLNENNDTGTLIGSISIEHQGTSTIDSFKLIGEDAQFFEVNKKGEIFSKEIFDFETKERYSLKVEARNKIGKSNQVSLIIKIKDIPDIKPTVQNITISISENRPIGTLIGRANIINSGDSEITDILITGYGHERFQITPNGDIYVESYLDYESFNLYYLQYRAVNKAGEGETANLTVRVTNLFENSGSDYPRTEDGIQTALDNSDYSFVLNQLLNNRDNYSGLDDDTVNMNIAGAYVGSSGYTIYDITGAMEDENNNSFNNFVNDITKNNDSVATINQLKQADTYYNNIVQGIDCNSTTITQIQKDSCYNLGLVRLTSLTNSVKLLFGGDSSTVEKWAEGVDVNSSDDLNGNGVLDTSEASACAVVYANNPDDQCQSGTIYSYRGGVEFNNNGNEYNLTLIEVDVGNSTNGYHNFYQFVSSNPNNNTPILTSGVCDRNFNRTTTNSVDGVNYFPCPASDSSGEVMGIKEQIEGVANIQSLFPDGDETKNTIQSYLTNITGSSNGTIGLDNLSTYLRTH